MKRAGWEVQLFNYLKASESVPFAWGVNDCCLFVARFVDAVTGSNHVAEWEGRYSTPDGAQSFMESKGFSKPSDIADSLRPRKDVKRVTRGDIVMFEGGSLGICAGRKSYFFIEGKGLMGLPTLKCLAAWEV